MRSESDGKLYVATKRYGICHCRWDAALQKALQLDSDKRYEALSEFIHDIKHANPEFLRKAHRHLMAKNPLWFWQSLSAILLLLIIVGIVAIYYPH